MCVLSDIEYRDTTETFPLGNGGTLTVRSIVGQIRTPTGDIRTATLTIQPDADANVRRLARRMIARQLTIAHALPT